MVWMLYGHALMAAGRKDDAEAVFRHWVEKEPGNGDAALRLAAVLADSGRAAEAESIVRANVARHGDTPEAAFVLGRALLGLARFDEAETAFRKVVHARPEHQNAQANLMELVWMRSGDVHDASRAIDRALRSQPGLAGLRITKARLLMSARRPREALAVIDEGLALAGQEAALLKAASTIALEVDGSRALDYARRLLQAMPSDPSARVELGNASLATGRAQAALEIAEALHRADPSDGRALAMKADALRMLDDPRCRELLDYRGLVRVESIDVPEGWAGLDAYVADLVADLERLHTLRAHPIGNSLREGSQIPLDPRESPFASIRAFPQAIDGSIRRYMQALGAGSDPMRRRNTGHYRLSGMWSVRLHPHGFHVNHYHPEGWISSACYLQLPPAMAHNAGEGWLKLGEPAFPTSPALGPEYFVKPEPGLLALFPSYMWHGTVPFSGKPGDTRLTIAFDVVPAATE
jgi:tetratricopeptide (TPR) repeat protein